VAGQQVERWRKLADLGEMVLGGEGAKEIQRLSSMWLVDEIGAAFALFNSEPPDRGLPKSPKQHDHLRRTGCTGGRHH
jgi:hypothetical protein